MRLVATTALIIGCSPHTATPLANRAEPMPGDWSARVEQLCAGVGATADSTTKAPVLAGVRYGTAVSGALPEVGHGTKFSKVLAGVPYGTTASGAPPPNEAAFSTWMVDDPPSLRAVTVWVRHQHVSATDLETTAAVIDVCRGLGWKVVSGQCNYVRARRLVTVKTSDDLTRLSCEAPSLQRP